MKTLHLDTGREWRGGQRQALLLLQGLERTGHPAVLLAPDAPLLARARAAGIDAYPWNAVGELDVGAAVAAARAIQEFAPDVVHAHGARRARSARSPAGAPGVRRSWCRGVDFPVAGHLFSRLKYRLPVDRYFCISRGVMEVMERSGIPRARLALVPSGIDLPDPAVVRAAAAKAPSLRETLGVSTATPVIGTVAALAPHKDHADLLRAAALVHARRPDVHFAWVGEGECRSALMRQRALLGLEGQVHLLGFRDDALELLVQFDLFALASYLEGLCTSLLDAQALGIPIVATAVGGIPDVIADGRTGRLVPARDPQAFAEALLEALDHPERTSEWTRAASESVRGFSAAAMVERSLQEYDAVSRERAARKT